MRTSDFDYPLRRDLIAQTPLEPRDHSRLLVVDRSSGTLQHRYFYDLGHFLKSGDLLVLNDSRVIPGRLKGHRLLTGGVIEILLLNRVGTGLWKALVKPGKRLRPGAKFEVDGITGEILEDNGGGTRLVYISDESVIQRAGNMPLPPYIHTQLSDNERYQTVYAKDMGSSAAPTAGLHFTRELLESLGRQGIRFAHVTLHVGLDTFRKVESENPLSHKIHSEFFTIGEEAAREINLAHAEGRRIISIGTTSVRVLEQAALLHEGGSHEASSGAVAAVSGWAELFILPGHRFRLVDGIITNFHLPRSTLMMLVCSFAGRDNVMEAYRQAMLLGYRLYSFGDAMLLL